jgi:hypothetical protein
MSALNYLRKYVLTCKRINLLEGNSGGWENVLGCTQFNTRRRFHDRQHHHDD